ncbi:hypothetical protein BBL07_21015 [Agrobacterium vitis]|nr:hypothetical protein BBL07_21015 [Agrobacterium vitis]
MLFTPGDITMPLGLLMATISSLWPLRESHNSTHRGCLPIFDALIRYGQFMQRDLSGLPGTKKDALHSRHGVATLNFKRFMI